MRTSSASSASTLARWEQAHGAQPTCAAEPAEDHPQDDGQPAE